MLSMDNINIDNVDGLSDTIRIAEIVGNSIVDGPGLRFVVFAQGCMLNCEGCHNPTAQSVDGGKEMQVDEIIAEMSRNPLTDGITFSGGEPLLQAGQCAEIAAAARAKGLDVWLFTGFKFEELLNQANVDQEVACLLENTDVLVDGPYIQAEKSLQLKWRGSSNQRVLDIRKSFEHGEAVLFGDES